MSEAKDSLTRSVEETKVHYRRLGNSGLKVSVPILGAMSIGTKKWQPWVIEEDEALPLLKAAYDRGNDPFLYPSRSICYFDVAID
jgi:hypothetical protein